MNDTFVNELHTLFKDAQHGPVNLAERVFGNDEVQKMLNTLKFYALKGGVWTAGYAKGGRFPGKFQLKSKQALCIMLLNAFGEDWEEKLKLKDKPIIDLNISSNNNGITIDDSSSDSSVLRLPGDLQHLLLNYQYLTHQIFDKQYYYCEHH